MNLLKTSFFLISLLVLPLFARGQSLKISESHEFERSNFSQIIGTGTEGNIYSIFWGDKMEVGISNPEMTTLIRRVKIKLFSDRYGEDVKFLTSKVSNGNIQLIGIIQTESSISFMKQILDKDGNISEDWTEITKFSASVKNMEVSYNTVYSEDQSRTAIWLQYSKPKDKTYYFKLTYLNEDLDVLWEEFFEHEFDRFNTRQESFKIDPFGNIYVILSQFTEFYTFKSALNSKTRAIYLKSLLTFSSNNGSIHVRALEAENQLLENLNVYFDERKVHIAGFGAKIDDEWNRLTEFALASFPIQDTGQVIFSFIPFGSEIKKSSIYLPEDKGTRTSFYTKERMTLTNKDVIYLSEYEYYYDGQLETKTILLLCLDSSGQMKWQRIIDRYSESMGNYGGYALIFDGNQIGILFSDNLKNYQEGKRKTGKKFKSFDKIKTGCLTLATIDIEGNIEYQMIMGYKESGKKSNVRQFYRVNKTNRIALETQKESDTRCFTFFQFE